MSLRTALAALPDDRNTAIAVREVVAFFAAHQKEPMDLDRVSRATSLGSGRVETVAQALCSAGVLHCDGDPRLKDVSFEPDHILAMEVDRFLRTSGLSTSRFQASVGKYRNRFGHT